jgi:hypothetical protein
MRSSKQNIVEPHDGQREGGKKAPETDGVKTSYG